MIYANGRELAEAFGVKISRWKRWGREFLPPDPLGGYQSGYCRQYNFRDIFIVALAGHLVSDFKVSIPDARKIIAETKSWLKGAGFMELGPNPGISQPGAPQYRLQIISAFEGIGQPVAAQRFAYRVLVHDEADPGPKAPRVVWSTALTPAALKTTRTVHLTALYRLCCQAQDRLRQKQLRSQG